MNYEQNLEQRAVGEEICGECFHPIRMHGEDGCECYRTRQIDGSSETESGPCGCMEEESDAEMGLRRTGSFAEGQARLAAALDLLTLAATRQMERE